ncbi:hypothetical protein PCCS19_59340 [Paenibacillus sp. CCS19]|nr:hypothetical protein PCCS19_59340 [Paenibacillus cellulosilyticus]
MKQASKGPMISEVWEPPTNTANSNAESTISVTQPRLMLYEAGIQGSDDK